jgi:quinol monooxygenase YgiN
MRLSAVNKAIKAHALAAGAHMPHVLIIHEVEAYPAWKRVFDQASEIRKRAGEISYQLLRYDTDANNIVHFSQWSSLENARRFFESPELVAIRKQAGVKAPDFIYLQEIERGVL